MIINGANSKASEMREQLGDFLSRNLSNPRLGWPRRLPRHRHSPRCCDADHRTGEELCGTLERRFVNCLRSSARVAA